MRAAPAMVLVALLATGCRPAVVAPVRGPISGSVTLDGRPAEGGAVRFIALFPNGVNALAPVAGGRYALDAARGLMQGRYRVEFSMPTGRMRRSANPDQPGEWLEEPQESLPVRYHRESTYVLDYDPAAPASFDAELQSR